jgi:hypothetical protein
MSEGRGVKHHAEYRDEMMQRHFLLLAPLNRTGNKNLGLYYFIRR